MIPLKPEFMQAMRQMLGPEAPAFFDALNQPPTLALRLNPARSGAAELARDYVQGEVPWEANGRYLLEGARPGASIAHAAGAFYLQEASAMVSTAALGPQRGERILDLCAAPGGKSGQIAAAIREAGLLISNEPEYSRAKVLASNLERLGARNAAVVSAWPQALAQRWPGYFDAVLCDAPCSGEGMFRREPESRLEWNENSPRGCAKRQAEILDQAAELVRPGGRLVYSTCTFNPLENEETIAAFLDRHPDFHGEDFSLPGAGASRNGMLRIWPHRMRGDGHFAARLRRDGDEIAPDLPPVKADRACAEFLRALEAETGPLPFALRARPARLGDAVYALPELCPDTAGLKVISPGVQLMRLGRNYVQPAHALAMAMDPAPAPRRMELDDEAARAYLAGETVPCGDARGWTLMCWQGLALGWGKASGGQMKNHLPKGLRRTLREI